MTSPDPSSVSTVLGFPADAITAISTLALCVVTGLLAGATIGLALVARMQLPLLAEQLDALNEQLKQGREESDKLNRRQIEANTLRVCDRYTGDPVVHAAAARIWNASKGGTEYRVPPVDGHDLITCLNYLDSIAVGVKQGVYSGMIVKDHMASTFEKAVDKIIPEAKGGNFKYYQALLWLRNSWRDDLKTDYSADQPR